MFVCFASLQSKTNAPSRPAENTTYKRMSVRFVFAYILIYNRSESDPNNKTREIQWRRLRPPIATASSPLSCIFFSFFDFFARTKREKGKRKKRKKMKKILIVTTPESGHFQVRPLKPENTLPFLLVNCP